jgi:hypothetical protein
MESETNKAARSRTTNRLMAVRAPWKSTRGRRIRDLFHGFMSDLEVGNVIHESAALRAAELAVSAEEMRAKLAAGEKCAEDVVRLENAARRAERDLKALTPKPVAWWEQNDDAEEDH